MKTMLESQADKKKELEEANRIMEQIALAKWAYAKRSTTQGKNVLRVMLGEKPQVPRNENSLDKIFPVEKTVPGPDTRTKSLPKKKVKKNDPPLGEKAIMKGMKKAHDHQSGVAFGFFKAQEDMGIQLTLIECYILSVFCCEGIPLNFDLESKNSSLGGVKTWDDISKSLSDMARQQHLHAKDVVIYCRAALSKGINQNVDEKHSKILAANLSKAETDLAAKEEAARLTIDFTNKPCERLSKKRYVLLHCTFFVCLVYRRASNLHYCLFLLRIHFHSFCSIMLMEKVRAYDSTKVISGKGTTKYENYLGPKISKWFGKELVRAAATHDILNHENKPQSWTTADISDSIQNNPDYNKSVVSAFLDKAATRQITSQVALLSRLRSILAQYGEKDFRAKLLRAIKQSKRADDEWEKQPEWWDDSTEEHSFLLLTKLNEYGYTNIMLATKSRDGFGAPDEDYGDMIDLKLTKPSIQTRANQLVRELNTIEDHESMLQMVAKRRKSSQGKFDSLAAVNSSTTGSKNNSPTNGCNGTLPPTPTSSTSGQSKKTTVQTGLKAFFSATPSSSGKKKTDADSVGKKPSPVGNKRKESTPSSYGNITGSSSASSSGDENGAPPPVEKKLKAASKESTLVKMQLEKQQSNSVEAEAVVID